jgi:iron complex outermembrane receptor protein
LGGVIHVLEPVPPPAGSLRGMLNSQFASNNRLYGNSLMLEGNRNGLIWQARAGMKSAAPYRTPKETVYNSGYQEDAQHALIGLNRQWGYTHLHASRWSSLIGLTEGERDPVSGKFIDADGNTYDEETLERRKPVAPRQRVEHLRITSTNSIIRNNTRLRLNAGFQENKRREYEESDTPGISMQLRTGTADARIYTTVNSNTEIAAGLSGVWRINRNLGSEYIIPDYHGLDGGVFITGKKENGRSTITGGIRFDVQRVTTTELIEGSDTLFPSVERDFSAFSGSVGIARAVSERTTLKLNAGKGFRAPSVPELTSNGLHEGTFRYEIGNAGLSPEHSWELDAGLMHDREKFSVHLDLFIGWLDNYIYYERSEGENRFVDGDSFPVYRYVQANAFRRGGELTFDLHPVEALHFENSLSLVFAENTSLDRPLPFTPPIRSVHEIRYDLERKQAAWARRMFIKLNLENVLKQDRIDEFETPTDGYLLLNAGAGLEGRLLSCDFHLFLNIRNITNTYYYDHLSRYKDIGVGGAGRNITLGLEVEFGN